ncbi:MAG: LTA synthase family protein [Clostridiales bacterium]|nr:LTA synthase family protein [Clostridiales bacterium]
MNKYLRAQSLLLYFFVSVLFYEIILKVATMQPFYRFDLFYMAMFGLSFSIIFYLLSSLFSGKDKFGLTFVLLLLLSLIFSSQMVYYKFFKTFYTLYSAGRGGQVMEFWKDILYVLSRNWVWFTLFFLPPITILFLKNRVVFCRRPSVGSFLVLLFLLILVNVLAIGDIYLGDRQVNSHYELYYNPGNPLLTAQKLGLLTSLRLDAQRLIFMNNPIDSIIKDKAKAEEVFKPVDPENDIKEPIEPAMSEDIDEEPVEEQPEPIFDPNIMDIDFTQLIASETDDDLKDMHKYFSEVPPTNKNEYTGKYKGYNLILITAESFSPYAVHKDVTPTLYKMVHEGYNFTNFYTPIWEVSTLDGEYVASTSLLPKRGVWSLYLSGSISMPFTMGNQLRALGYNTRAYHNHSYDYYRRDLSHPNMGYDYKGIGNGLVMSKAWPRSDLEMMEKTIPEYLADEPFHTYYMTVSGHMQYNFIGNHMAIKNKELVKDLPYTDAGRAYMATQIEFDRAMEYLLNQLEEAGIAERTLIAISSDHYPYGLEKNELDDLAGHTLEENFELYKNTFILYTKGMEPVTIDKPSSSLDIIPTLSNLLGLEYDSRLLMGRDIFSDSESLVIFLNRSFITDKGRYDAEKKIFYPSQGQEVSQGYIDNILDIVEKKFYYSAKVLDTDYYKYVLNN